MGRHNKYHLIREIVSRGDAVVAKITSVENLANSFTKTLPQKTFESHLNGLCVKCIGFKDKCEIVRVYALKSNSFCMTF
jgi:hypothetical protein